MIKSEDLISGDWRENNLVNEIFWTLSFKKETGRPYIYLEEGRRLIETSECFILNLKF